MIHQIILKTYGEFMKKILFVMFIMINSISAHEVQQVKASGITYPLSCHAVQRMRERGINAINLSNLLAHGKSYENTENTQLVVNTNNGYGAVVSINDRVIITVMINIFEDRLQRKLQKVKHANPTILKQKDIKYLKHSALIPSTEKSMRKKLKKSTDLFFDDENYQKKLRNKRK